MLYPSIFNDNLFDDWFDDSFFWPTPARRPSRTPEVMKTDVKETDKGYQVEIDLPGVKKEDVTCEVKDGYLTVSAQKKTDNDEKDEKGKYIRRERYSGSFSRSFYVGDKMTENDIHAAFADGILKLDIPKLEEEEKQVEDKRHLVQIEG